jgi:UDP-4-amino-4,6-dideoxy-N-acetyl-beta-L-altrosamine transaminase
VKSPIPYGRHSIDDEDIQAVVDVLRHGWLTQGPKVAEFEEAVARYVGARYAVAVSSGTAALHIACMAGGVSTGDVLVTSVNTFVASANCALYVGAVPQFSDIDPESLNLDPARLAKRCEELGKVKAIVPVHFAGAPCDLPAMRRIAASRGAMIIEDAAHAFGATYPDGRRVGCCADSEMTVFSFHPVKIIATAEGGIVTTNDEDLYRDLLRLRSHGINKNSDPFRYPECAATDGIPNPWYYEMQEIGFNYRMTDIQSALGLSQLAKVDRFLARRHELALRYDRLLAEVPHVSLTQLSSRAASSHHLYVVRIDFDRIGCSRAQLMHQLRARNIVTQVHYIPAHTHPYYRAHGHERDRFPVAEDYYRQGLSLPLYYGLTDEQQDYVVRQIKEILQ